MQRVLLLLLLALVASLRVDAATHRSVSTASASARQGPIVNPLDHDDDEEDDDDWDFLSDAAVVAAADAQRRAVPCATTLDPSFLNDDYCDCMDGSDEPATGACALMTHTDTLPLWFHCLSPDADGQRVAAAFVRDGVCDCCDGSDEAWGICGNTCTQRRHTRLDTLRSRQRLVQAARKTRATYASMAATRIPQLHEQFNEVAGRATALQRAFQYKQQQLESHVAETGEEPSPQQIHELRQMYVQLNHWQYHAYIAHQLADPATFDASLNREAFVALVGECFPFTVNEKQLKGGSSNVIPREYVIVFCPFQNITQTEPNYGQWQRAERESKTGIHNQDEATDTEEPTQPAITMGIWGQWLDTAPSPTEGDSILSRQEFTHGEPCANGQERVVNVDIMCGDDNRVVSVEEPDMCVYSLRFETPAACTVHEELALAKKIQSIAKEEREKTHGHEEL